MLTVPTPLLGYEPLAPGLAALELPITASVGPVRLDGQALDPRQVAEAGIVLCRQRAAGVAVDVWDPAGRQWRPEGQAVPPAATALAPTGPPATPWQAIVVAAGGTDAAGQPQFARAAAGGLPCYTLRARVVTRGGQSGLSRHSAPLRFAAVADRALVVLGPGEGERPDRATQARLLLRDPGLQVIGGVEVRRDAPGATVTVSNAAGARVVLRPDGGIELHPAPGRGVLVGSDLEVEHLRYRPAGGGPKRDLG